MITRFTAIEPTARNARFFAGEGKTVTPSELAAGVDPACRPADWFCGWPTQFDYLVWVDFGRRPAILPPHLQLWTQGSFFTLYRITADAVP